MYNEGSAEFNTLISKAGGSALKARLSFASFVIDTFKSLKYNGGSNNSNDIAIGMTNMAYIEGEAITNIHIINQEFLLEVGIELSDGTTEYAPMGYFKIQNPDEDENNVKFVGYDRMQKFDKPYTSNLTYPTDSTQILNELCEMCGVELATPITDPITIEDNLQGYTCREVLGYVAGIHGFFACIDRYGKLNLRWYSETPVDKQIGLIWSLTKSQKDYKVEKVTLAKDGETTYASGEGISGINHSNPYATQGITDSIYASLGNFTYRPCEISMLDDIRLDPWDMLKVTYLDGSVYKIPIMSLVHDFNACETQIKAFGKSDTENEYSYTGPVTQAMDRMATEILVANRIIATKVDAEWVNAHTVTADKLEATNARVKNLETYSLTAEEADLRYANITLANIDIANINVTKIGELFAQVGLIDKAVISEGHITGYLDSVEVNANKITAGTLAVDRLLIKDSSGNYKLATYDKSGNIVITTVDGSIITDRTITADHIVAHSITSNEITTDNIVGSNGWINLAKGTFNYGGKLIWDGKNLTISAESITTVTNNLYTTKEDFTAVETIATQTADKFNWLVKSGTSATDFTLTDRTATLVSEYINLKGLVTFSGLSSSAVSSITNTIEVGGRNLIRNSAFDNGYAYWSHSAIATLDTTKKINNHYTIKIASSGQTANKYYGISSSYLPVNPSTINKGDTYTLSFWYYVEDVSTFDYNFVPNIKGTDISTSSTVTLVAKYITPSQLVEGKWTKVIITFTSAYDCSYFYLAINVQRNGTIWVTDFKLEKGNKDTDWSPAPEDISVENVYTPNTTTIDGGKITTGSIDALKIAIGLGGNIYPNYDTFANITDDTLYYQKYSSATASLDLTNGLYGDKCLKLVSSGTDAYVYLGAKANGYGCVRVQADKIYRVSCYVKSSSSSSVQLYVVGHTAKNTTNSQHIGAKATIGTSWTRIERTYTASSTYPYISIRIDNDTSGTTIYVDGIQIEEVSSTSQKASPFKPCNSTIIDGNNIITGSITADKIDVNNLNSLSAKIGEFYIDNRIYSQSSDTAPSADGQERYIGIFQPYNVGNGAISNRPVIEVVRQYYSNGAVQQAYPFWVGYDGGIHATFGEIGKFTLGDTIYSQDTSTTPTMAGEFRRTGSFVPYSSGAGVASNRSLIEVKIETIVDGKLTATYPFWVGYDGGLHATKATITGTISGGSIISKGSSSSPTKLGDWDIVSSSGGTDLYSYNSTTKRGTGISTSGTNAIGVGFKTTSNWMDAPFRVTHDGKCYASAINITSSNSSDYSCLGNFSIDLDGNFIGSSYSSDNLRLEIYPKGKSLSGKGICYMALVKYDGTISKYFNSTGWH